MRSAAVMNGFSAALRQAKKCNCASSVAARRRFANAATGSAKNITPKRDTIPSKRGASKIWSCASARMKRAAASAPRKRATSIIGAEMSTPMHCDAGPSCRAIASVVAPVPQPTSSTLRGRRAATASTRRASNGSNIASSAGCASTQARPALPFHRADCPVSACLASLVVSTSLLPGDGSRTLPLEVDLRSSACRNWILPRSRAGPV